MSSFLLALLSSASPSPELGASSVEKTLNRALGRVQFSLVSLWPTKDDKLSGVLISPRGLIATCAHVPAQVGSTIKVQLADGRWASGKVAFKFARDGENRAGKDIALVQILESGSWPFVQTAQKVSLKSGSPVLSLGFPDTGLYGQNRGSHPSCLRLGRVIDSPYRRSPREIYVTSIGSGGDSGGPLFDLNGVLVGICSGASAGGEDLRYTDTLALRVAWDRVPKNLAQPAWTTGRPNPELSFRSLEEASTRLRSCSVEVRSRSRWTGIGCVVSGEFILAKASDLGPDLTVVINDRSVAIAEPAAVDPARDLALLRLPYAPELIRDIPPIEWTTCLLRQGLPLSIVVPRPFSPLYGIVSVTERSIPALQGIIPVGVEDNPGGGARVKEVLDWSRRFRLRPPSLPLKIGDVVTAIGGKPVRNAQDFVRLGQDAKAVGGHPLVAGEPLSVSLTRQGKEETVTVVLEYASTPPTQLIRPDSLRFSGFPRAVATDIPIRPEHCGAAVVDSRGRAVGLMIARAPFTEAFMLPAREVRASIQTMAKKARQSGG